MYSERSEVFWSTCCHYWSSQMSVSCSVVVKWDALVNHSTAILDSSHISNISGCFVLILSRNHFQYRVLCLWCGLSLATKPSVIFSLMVPMYPSHFQSSAVNPPAERHQRPFNPTITARLFKPYLTFLCSALKEAMLCCLWDLNLLQVLGSAWCFILLIVNLFNVTSLQTHCIIPADIVY